MWDKRSHFDMFEKIKQEQRNNHNDDGRDDLLYSIWLFVQAL